MPKPAGLELGGIGIQRTGPQVLIDEPLRRASRGGLQGADPVVVALRGRELGGTLVLHLAVAHAGARRLEPDADGGVGAGDGRLSGVEAPALQRTAGDATQLATSGDGSPAPPSPSPACQAIARRRVGVVAIS